MHAWSITNCAVLWRDSLVSDDILMLWQWPTTRTTRTSTRWNQPPNSHTPHSCRHSPSTLQAPVRLKRCQVTKAQVSDVSAPHLLIDTSSRIQSPGTFQLLAAGVRSQVVPLKTKHHCSIVTMATYCEASWQVTYAGLLLESCCITKYRKVHRWHFVKEGQQNVSETHAASGTWCIP